jgi:N4-gp56 family major capsid protein
MTITAYGDISPRTAAYACKDLLERGVPYLVFEKFGQAKPIPKNSSKVQKFRRYEALDPTPAALTEGVQPAATQLTNTDVTATLVQYGDLVNISDVVADTHEDPVLKEATEILGEQAAQMIEAVRFNVLKAGTNVEYANGSARNTLAGKISTALQRKCIRTLKRNNAKKITKIVRSTASYATENVAPSYIGIVHPDCESDIRDMTGFVPAESYGQISPYENEIGKVEDVRYVTSTVIEPWLAAGAADSGTYISDGGSNNDVYPVLYLARDAYAIVPLKGGAALTPSVLNPNTPRGGDALGQNGWVGWKAMTTCVILNDDWMVRAEVCASA